MFYNDEANSCQVLAMRFGDEYEAVVQTKFVKIMAYFNAFDVDNASDAEWDEIINRIIMLWLGDLNQAAEWTGKQCPSDCTAVEPWPEIQKSPKRQNRLNPRSHQRAGKSKKQEE